VNKIGLGSLSFCVWALGTVLTACAGSSGQAPGSTSGGDLTLPGTDVKPDPSAQACQTSDDCVVVEIACCDHCNGGEAQAFNKARADEYRPKNCQNTACTRRGCGDAVAVCANNLCKVEIQPL
jgi:hypothetical protein